MNIHDTYDVEEIAEALVNNEAYGNFSNVELKRFVSSNSELLNVVFENIKNRWGYSTAWIKTNVKDGYIIS